MEKESAIGPADGCGDMSGPIRPARSNPLASAMWVVMGAGVAVVDLFSGPYIQFPFFFLFPIGLASWHDGRMAGMLLAVGLPLIRPIYFLEFWESGYDTVAVTANVIIKILVFTAFAELISRIGAATRFRAQVLACLPLGMWVADRRGRIVQANPAGRDLWGGIPPVPGSGTGAQVKLHGTDRAVDPEGWALFRALRNGEPVLGQIVDLERPDGTRRIVSASAIPLWNEHGVVNGAILTNLDITEAKRSEREREELIRSLEEAQRSVKILSGLLPVCANCKRIRNDNGSWQQMESYIRAHSEAEFSHGICPDCMSRLYPEFQA